MWAADLPDCPIVGLEIAKDRADEDVCRAQKVPSP